MIKIAGHWTPAILALSVVLLTFAFVACGSNEESREDVPTATAAGGPSSATTPTADTADGTPGAASGTATPVAEVPNTSEVSLDEYIMKVCGETVTEVNSWEEGDSLRELSAGLGFVSEQMSALKPPSEVAEWHDAQIAFAGAFKKTIDDFLEDPRDRTEDEFILSMFLTVAHHFAPVEQAIAGMLPDVRFQMIEAGCIDEETTDSVAAQPEIQREEIPVGGSASGTLSESEGIANLQFQAEMGQKYVIEVSWEGLTRIRLLIKDPPDPRVSFIDQSNSSDSPIVHQWTAPESGTFHVEVWALEGAGSFNISVSLDDTPGSPVGVSATWDGSAVKVSWDPVDGADYYNVYHDDGGINVYCEVDSRGNASFCTELATDVTSTNYVDTDPSRRENHYWVSACNSSGCSEIDSDSPASP